MSVFVINFLYFNFFNNKFVIIVFLVLGLLVSKNWMLGFLSM